MAWLSSFSSLSLDRVVLLGPTVDRNQEEQIKAAMGEAPSSITGDAGYIPNAKLPNYEQFIQIVAKVRPIETRVREKPAVLTLMSRKPWLLPK